ncbi:MAG: hypothetical protein WCI88_04415 [Chloroflexota bacterium]
MDNKITIIEGPTPTFELVNEVWPFGLNESPDQCEIVKTTLRTANGAALVERCHKAWRQSIPMRLEFRSEEGIKQEAPIMAARYMTTSEGDVIWLWVRFETDATEMALAIEEEDTDDDDDDDWDILGSSS